MSVLLLPEQGAHCRHKPECTQVPIHAVLTGPSVSERSGLLWARVGGDTPMTGSCSQELQIAFLQRTPSPALVEPGFLRTHWASQAVA